MTYTTLNDTDFKLFSFLEAHIYLTFEQIRTAIYLNNNGTQKSVTAVRQRLNKLEEDGYITRFKAQVTLKSKRPNVIYCLTKIGSMFLESMQGYTHFKPVYEKKLPMWYMHQLAVNDVVLSYEKHKITAVNVLEYANEQRTTYQYNDGRDDVIRPDGVVLLERQDGYVIGIMLEVERSKKARKFTYDKLMRYKDFFHQPNNTMKKFHIYAGFEEFVDEWRLLFVSNDDENFRKLKRDFRTVEFEDAFKGQNSFDVMIAKLEDVKTNPYGAIYNYFKPGFDFDEFRTL
ncbi:TPA: replication-relaxation family protein [Staphylococcus aureus]|nr:replication-relaxation family protein [Staphylococcus aureus]